MTGWRDESYRVWGRIHKGQQGAQEADYQCLAPKGSPSLQVSCKPGSKAPDHGSSSTIRHMANGSLKMKILSLRIIPCNYYYTLEERIPGVKSEMINCFGHNLKRNLMSIFVVKSVSVMKTLELSSLVLGTPNMRQHRIQEHNWLLAEWNEPQT